ncbi:MAG: FAD-binding protein [Caulobacterales bacterium]|nr:FAD-binding protein [Caulobacterales bacterium]
MAAWSNWSGSVKATPAQVARPKTYAELQAMVAAAAKVRVVGAGHSFMPLCETDGLLLNLEDLEGRIVVAADRRTVTAPAGWSLKRLTQALWDEGLSLPNQGDVNPQSLAGAIGTGTHGTGRDLGSLSTMAQGFRLVGPDGVLVDCDRVQRRELFEAQRLGLGLFGVATEITIDVLPAYRLEERIEKRPLAEMMEGFEEIAARHRHAEFFVFPYSDQVILKTLHPTDAPDTYERTTDVDERPFRIVNEIATAVPALIPPLHRLMMTALGASGRVGPAYQVFPSDRTIRFEEMEYELPRANGLPALMEVIRWIRKGRKPVAFPFEFRLCAADDIWLSPFNLGPGASISMHQYARMAWRDLFAEAETIFQGFGGRPHWAKRHTLTRADVDRLYPMAERFRDIRRAADPGGKFLNPHLEALFA